MGSESLEGMWHRMWEGWDNADAHALKAEQLRTESNRLERAIIRRAEDEGIGGSQPCTSRSPVLIGEHNRRVLESVRVHVNAERRTLR